jgi:hypothetical protein
VQGLMMAVLERVRQEKGDPVVGEAEKRMWSVVKKAVLWALESRLPEGVGEKVGFVKEKMERGTWAVAVRGEGKRDTGMMAGGAEVMPEPLRSYGFGMGMGVMQPGMRYPPQSQPTPYIQHGPGQDAQYTQQQPPVQTLYTQVNGERTAVLPSAMQNGYRNLGGRGYPPWYGSLKHDNPVFMLDTEGTEKVQM